MSTREGQHESELRNSFSGTTGLRLGGTKAVRWSRISFVLSALYCRVATVLYTDVQNSRDSGVQHTISVQTPLRLHSTKVLYIGVVVQSGAPPPVVLSVCLTGAEAFRRSVRGAGVPDILDSDGYSLWFDLLPGV